MLPKRYSGKTNSSRKTCSNTEHKLDSRTPLSRNYSPDVPREYSTRTMLPEVDTWRRDQSKLHVGIVGWITRTEFRTSERRLNLVLYGNPVPKPKPTSCEVYKGSKRSLCRAAVISWPMRATVATLLVASYRVGYSLKLGRAPLPWGTGASRDGRCACSQQVSQESVRCERQRRAGVEAAGRMGTSSVRPAG